MATKKGTYNLYTWTDFDYTEFINKYRHTCENWKEEWIDDDTPSPYIPLVPVNGLVNIRPFSGTKKVNSKTALQDDVRIIRKCKYLQHSIIEAVHKKAYSGDKESHHIINLNTSLARDVIGDDIYPMRKVLIEMGYISIQYFNNENRYTRFSYSTTYKVKECLITKTPSIDKTIEKYINTFKKKWKENRDKFITMANLNVVKKDEFIKNYNLSLNKFQIIDINKFNKELDKHNYTNLHIYNNYVINSFSKEKEINTIDYKNNRIYHVLTNLKREYKQYINIKYSIDSKNSHPLLFCYFLFNYHDIPVDMSYKISSIFTSIYKNKENQNIPHYHYDGKYLCNILKYNGIEESKIANIEDDELEYIYLSTNGVLWDCIYSYIVDERDDILSKILEDNDKITSMDDKQRASEIRSIIKEKMFAQVFYSHSGYLTKNDNGEDLKPLARYFKECYPTVYKILCKFKNLSKCKDEKIFHCLSLIDLDYIENPHGVLPNAMMKLEASIFTSALEHLYKKRYRAVNIHDAIVVPDIKNAPPVEVVEKILRKCYAENGLHPTFSIDYYH